MMAGTGPREWVPSRHPAPVVSIRTKRLLRRRIGGFGRFCIVYDGAGDTVGTLRAAAR